MQVFKTTGIEPKQLAEHPKRPSELFYIWQWFINLHGREPLTFTEILNWSTLSGIKLKSWEVDTLKAIDRLYWEIFTNE